MADKTETPDWMTTADHIRELQLEQLEAEKAFRETAPARAAEDRRFYAACLAMEAILQSPGMVGITWKSGEPPLLNVSVKPVVEASFAIADAMLAKAAEPVVAEPEGEMTYEQLNIASGHLSDSVMELTTDLTAAKMEVMRLRNVIQEASDFLGDWRVADIRPEYRDRFGPVYFTLRSAIPAAALAPAEPEAKP